jgi:hypothetical protein
MNKIWYFFTGYWDEIIISLGAIVVFGLLLIFNLSKQPHLLSGAEVNSVTAAHNLDFSNLHPINLLYNLPLHFALRLHSSTGSLRVVSVIYGLALLILLYAVLSYWFNGMASAAGVALLATSSWFLNLARVGTPDILFAFGSVVLIASCMLFLHTRLRNTTFILFLGCLAALVYIPGFVWLVVGVLLWSRKKIFICFKRVSNYEKVIGLLFGLAILLPLVWSLSLHPDLLKPFLGLPNSFDKPLNLVKNLYNIPLTIFFRSTANPQYWLGNLPLLDVVETVLFIFGVYRIVKNHKKAEPRNVFLYGILACVILVALGGPVSIAILLPVVFIIILQGLLYLWGLWISVFPKNPIAMILGLTLVAMVLGVSCNYQLRRYFVAWQGSPTTSQVFSHSFPHFDTITTSKEGVLVR